MTVSTRLVWFLLSCAALLACDNPKQVVGVDGGGSCASDNDCVVGSCPNLCNQGRPWCSLPRVYVRDVWENACPCAKTPSASSCAAPPPTACEPLPGCAERPDARLIVARCVSGQCTALLPDGGVPAP